MLCLLGPGVVHAAPTPADGVDSFLPQFFDDARPAHALDMVRRLPGFSYEAGNSSVRGFSGAAGNVLIDGERPSTKSISLDDVLSRIQPESIERIDLVRAGAGGLDMQGRPVVANVIRKPGSATTGSIEVGPQITDGAVSGDARLQWSRRDGALSVDLDAVFDRDIEGGSGKGRLARRDASGSEAGDYLAAYDETTVSGGGSLEYRRAADTVRLNLSGARDLNRRLDRARLTRDTAQAIVEESVGEGSERRGELGADYERRFGDIATARIVALQRLTRQHGVDRYANPGGSGESRSGSTTGETILRGALHYGGSDRLTLDGGAEGAFNFLESGSLLLEDGIAVAVPNANVRVEERRGETFATASLALAPYANLEIGARYEASTISQSGDAARERSFGFFKPRALAAFSDGSRDLRLRVEREVGQLNFRDFAASADVALGAVSAGNADLEPPHWWTAELTLEQRFWDAGSLAVTVKREWVDNVIDMTPIVTETESFDALGNLGAAVRDVLRVNVNLPFDQLGVPGGLARIDATWRRSSVYDPLILSERPVSWQRPFHANLWLSRDLPELNSTIMLSGHVGWRDTAYRLGEERTNWEQPWMTLYWDWKVRPDLSLRAQVENLWARERGRDRTFYADTRASGVVSGVEALDVQRDRTFMLRLRKTL